MPERTSNPVAGSGTRSIGTGTEAQAWPTVAITIAAARRKLDLDMHAPEDHCRLAENASDAVVPKEEQESIQRFDLNFIPDPTQRREKVP